LHVRKAQVRNPAATRPWQHVLEPLAGYLKLAEALAESPQVGWAFNFGPSAGEVATVRDVVLQARETFGRGEIEWGTTPDDFHEARALSLDNSKACEVLGVRPVWTLEQSIARTMQWHGRQLAGENARALCEEDMDAYCSAA
jgi:CDP-glucose 4,6-dehydratase